MSVSSKDLLACMVSVAKTVDTHGGYRDVSIYQPVLFQRSYWRIQDAFQA